MAVILGPEKGAEINLILSPLPPRRILIGLGWDPKDAPQAKAYLPDASSDFLGILMRIVSFPVTLVTSLNKLIRDEGYLAESEKTTVLEELKSTVSGGPLIVDDAVGRDVNSSAYDLDLYCYVLGADGLVKAIVGTDDNEEIDASQKITHSGDNRSGLGGGDDEQIFVETIGLPDDYQHLFFVVVSDSKYRLDQIPNATVRLADSRTNSDILKCSINPPADAVAYSYAFCHVFRDGDGWKLRNMDEYGGDTDWPTFLSAKIGK